MRKRYSRIIFISLMILILISFKLNLLTIRISNKISIAHIYPAKFASGNLSKSDKIEQDLIEKDESLKVLVWTSKGPFGKPWLRKDEEIFCPKTNCALSTNRKDLNISDAIILTWRGVKLNDIPHVIDNQKLVLYNMEPPHLTGKTLDRLGLEKIDWIMSYRIDSDIYIPYGKVVECNTTWKQSHSFENKTKSIAWFVSDCQTPSNREKYVKILKKYIDVDIYGSCGRLKCRRKNPECDEMMAKNYKFYLSFENSVK